MFIYYRVLRGLRLCYDIRLNVGTMKPLDAYGKDDITKAVDAVAKMLGSASNANLEIRRVANAVYS